MMENLEQILKRIHAERYETNDKGFGRLYADIFKYLSSGYERQTICDLRDNAIVNGREAIKSCHKNLPVLLNNIPPEWELDNKFIYDKLMQLFDSKWIDGCIDNFIDCINDNLEN